MTRALHAYRVGRIAYAEAHALQERLVDARQKGAIEDTILLLEHDPVVTLGRSARDDSNLLLSPEEFSARGIEVHETGRGGDVTYHGPGQLVGYPIVDLSDRQDVRKYVASLEETMIRIAGDHGLIAERLEGYNGTWIDPHGAHPRKIGAVGVRISRWVTMHGFAFNVCPDLTHFGFIVPCGLHDKGVTSLAQELANAQELAKTPTPKTDKPLAETPTPTVDEQELAKTPTQNDEQELAKELAKKELAKTPTQKELAKELAKTPTQNDEQELARTPTPRTNKPLAETPAPNELAKTPTHAATPTVDETATRAAEHFARLRQSKLIWHDGRPTL